VRTDGQIEAVDGLDQFVSGRPTLVRQVRDGFRERRPQARIGRPIDQAQVAVDEIT